MHRTSSRRWKVSAAGLAIASLFGATPLTAEPPRVLAPGYRLELIAEAPRIVTPVGLTFDRQGQLLVIESHTHHRPTEYTGPAHDRILVVRDKEGDGQAEELVPFFAETDQTMSILGSADDWIYVATRREVMRIRDTNADGRADERVTLVRLETEGDYPHNGLAGLCHTPEGRLLFGLGENMGVPYRLVAADGSALAGGGEGGSVYTCNLDGSDLQRVATGFWNPFGSCFDPHGRLFTVDNDPDASPPCRLLHVVPAGDYGYQFRYGRSGRHPLQAWNGELPGTLPMAAGTGEAPCAVVPFRGQLWVTSWGDHRLETFTMQSHGATVRGQLSIAVQGDANFRPVGLAVSPDGNTLVFSDWVDRSYPVHGQGRLWRLVAETTASPTSASWPQLSAAEQQAQQLRATPSLQQLDTDDPFLRQATIAGLAANGHLDPRQFTQLKSADERRAWLEALRWQDPQAAESIVPVALTDTDTQVRLVALRLVAEQGWRQFLPQVGQLLEAAATSAAAGTARAGDEATKDTGNAEKTRKDGNSGGPVEAGTADPMRLTRLALATLAWLEQGDASKDTGPFEERLAHLVGDASQPAALRGMALRLLPTQHASLNEQSLASYADAPAPLQREALAVLRERVDPWATTLLVRLAEDHLRDTRLRADATAALAGRGQAADAPLQRLAQDAEPVVAAEARRGLGLGGVSVSKPDAADIDAWLRWVPEVGDAASGERIFFRATGGRCSTCHAHDGRGGSVGPDLSTIHRRADRRWLLQALLDPHRDVAPQYASVQWTTADGRTWTGVPHSGPGEEGLEKLVGADGQVVAVESVQIVERNTLNTSIMPTGLQDQLTQEELSDLLAFLLKRP